jgi:BMFP domain-containing protein YqiC
MGMKADKMGIYDHSDIKVGDIVIPASAGQNLRSGANWYPFATTLPSMPLRSIGRATPEQMAVANRRYTADRENERKAEVQTALASINLVYRTEWTEYEWGQRPDGVSYSADLEALKAHIKRIEAMGTREGYSRASDITQALVTPEFYAEIIASTSGVVSTARHDHEGMLGIFKARQ